MIVYPQNWEKIGQPIKLKEIEDMILQGLSEIPCNSLSFSGGLDSSLMLYFMLQIYKQVEAFTMGISELHPDVRYSKWVIEELENVTHRIYIPSQKEIEHAQQQEGDLEGDKAVRLFYKFVGIHTSEIIACDGIDEFMCGYYEHQKNPNEKTYYDYIRRLQKEQLRPLDSNSSKVKVYLPYLDCRLLCLLSKIPINKKVDSEGRKKIMVQMANGKVPNEVIDRRKYGFCDVLKIKESDGLCK